MSPKSKKVEAALKNLFSGNRTNEAKPKPIEDAVLNPSIAAVTDPTDENPETTIPAQTTPAKKASKTSSKTKSATAVKASAVVESKPIAQPQPQVQTTTAELEVSSAVSGMPVPETPPIPLPVAAVAEKNPEKKAVVASAAEPAGQPPTENDKAGKFAGETQLVVFTLDGELFGVEIALVESIIKMQHYTVVPNMPDYIVGVTNLRGYVLPVVDLRVRFNLPEYQDTHDTRIVVLMLNSEKVGMIVDAVSEVISVQGEDIDPTPLMVSTVNMEFVKGIAKLRIENNDEIRMSILLDIEKVLKLN